MDFDVKLAVCVSEIREIRYRTVFPYLEVNGLMILQAMVAT